jgi:hypothetical protein
MPVSLATSLNNTGVKSFKTDKAIPDYSILFWHRIHDWNTVNSIHGIEPSQDNEGMKIFRQYEIGNSDVPDITDSNINKVLQNYNYVVRCVSNSANWPVICDIRYDANTNMSTSQSTLLDIAGRHGYNLLGRVAPPLQNNYQAPYSETTDYTVYNSDHVGHFHQSEGLFDKIISINPNSTESFASFYVDPIFKDPKLNYINVKHIPQDIIVMYYGDSTLSLDYYDPYDITFDETNDVSANGYVLPMTMVHTTTNMEVGKIGVKNLKTFANSMSFVISSNTSGFHDHRTGKFGRVSTKPDPSYNVITELAKSIIFPNDADEQFTNGPDPIAHTHKLTYTTKIKLKEKRLKAFLSTSPEAPIEKGLIIGYSLGKHSGFTGDKRLGKGTLPEGWYFCDGTNGTPDLRGKYPLLNFKDANTVIQNTQSTIEISDIEVETINWKHGHVYKNRPQIPVEGSAGFKDSGSHSSNYDNDTDSNRTTRHTHTISSRDTFIDGSTNAKIGTIFNYEPPTVEIAFIMFNDTI